MLDVAIPYVTEGLSERRPTARERLDDITPEPYCIPPVRRSIPKKHKQTLLHEHGLLPIIRVSAHRAARETAKGVMPRIPKEAHIEDKEVQLQDGTTKLCHVYARDGALGLVEADVHGDPVFVPLHRGRIRPATARDGSFRWYGHYDLPELFGGGGTLTVRLDLTSEDEKRRLNRTELLSPIPSSDPDFKTLARLRNNAESNNSALEDKLFNKRAHSVGHRSQRAATPCSSTP